MTNSSCVKILLLAVCFIPQVCENIAFDKKHNHVRRKNGLHRLFFQGERNEGKDSFCVNTVGCKLNRVSEDSEQLPCY